MHCVQNNTILEFKHFTHTHITQHIRLICAKERITNAIFSSTNKRNVKTKTKQPTEIMKSLRISLSMHCMCMSLSLSVCMCVCFTLCNTIFQVLEKVLFVVGSYTLIHTPLMEMLSHSVNHFYRFIFLLEDI